jgi:hypothetical protein
MAELSPRANHHLTGRRKCMGTAPAAGKIPVLLETPRGERAEGAKLEARERKLDTREERGEREEG